MIKTEIINLKEIVNNGFSNVQKDLENLEKNFQQNLNRQNNIIIACIGIPLAILAILIPVCVCQPDAIYSK